MSTACGRRWNTTSDAPVSDDWDEMPRITRTRSGQFKVRLAREERELLRSLPDQLRSLLMSDDPGVSRLFPPAYRDDPEREAEYQRLMKEDLVARRLDALSIVEATVDADRLEEEQLLAWVGVLNDVRLVLGTSLGVTEDLDPDDIGPEDPRAGGLALYGYLSFLLETMVEALAGN